MKERDTTIDFLRGLSVILIVLIHVNAYFWTVPMANILANYSQFAVQVFVFCSAFVYFAKKTDAPFNLSYIWKRVKRLVIPYYIFVIFFFLFILFIKHESLSLQSISKWIFLLGDRDLNWLVVLFLDFLFLMPLLRYFYSKQILFWLFTITSILSSILLLFFKSPVHFRYIMWLPWSTVLIFTYLYVQAKHKDKFLIMTTIISGLLYGISRIVLNQQNHTLVFTENKYPPNIFYLSYGIICIVMQNLIHKKIYIEKTPLQKLFDFASKYSYPIFFIHFLYLYIFLEITPYKNFHWWGLFLILTTLSLASMWAWNKIKLFFFNVKEGKS
jgi:fucose 4-O-acetylase-like acetyltransferase